MEAGRIYRGDCVDVLREWPDACVDCCITDPPYNLSTVRGLSWEFSSHITMREPWDRRLYEGYRDFTESWLSEVSRVVRVNGNILVFSSFHNIHLLGFVLRSVLNLRVLQQITWFKPNAQPNITGRLLTESAEYFLWICNNHPAKAHNWIFNYEDSKAFNGGLQLRNVWIMPYAPPSEKWWTEHPCQKPLEVVERMVKIWSNPGDTVLDCFLGSGTTALACERLGRRWVGVENELRYIKAAKRRLYESRRQLTLF
jgi:DNA modification methylase